VAGTISLICDAVQFGRSVPMEHAVFIFGAGYYISTELYGVTSQKTAAFDMKSCYQLFSLRLVCCV
jgi:hypothetical protein